MTNSISFIQGDVRYPATSSDVGSGTKTAIVVYDTQKAGTRWEKESPIEVTGWGEEGADALNGIQPGFVIIRCEVVGREHDGKFYTDNRFVKLVESVPVGTAPKQADTPF